MPGVTRRFLLFGSLTAAGLRAAEKGASFPSDATRYPDPVTSIDVYRLTSPEYSTTMTAYYNRGIARNSGWMLCCCDRVGSPQGFRLDLKGGEMKQLTEAEDLDGTTLTLLPDNRAFCYAAGRSVWLAPATGGGRKREVYRIAEGWERAGGISVGPDGTHVTLAERKGDTWRLRIAPLTGTGARTVIESPTAMTDPIARPMRAQILYRQAEDAMGLVNMDGTQNRRLKLAPGGVGTPDWATDGRTLLYLNFPLDHTQLNNFREFNPDANTDKTIGKTSQYESFSANHDASVFVAASRNNASPDVFLYLRVTQSERTLCEHKSRAGWVDPVFAPDSQRIYFQSDRHGKPAIYCMHVEKLVEKTEAG
ncbi:MAG: PD40 domain-containing protein [Acidobacteria bacterium]|nr:PD40 domain-containing protein [Acidobacteriota bacterium]